MWTTQEVYQNEVGGSGQSAIIGTLAWPLVAALEYDTYVGLGKIDTTLVRSTSILGGDWNPAMFRAAWYTTVRDGEPVIPGTPDEDNRLFLARITVSSDRAFGDYTPSEEYLGGGFYIGGGDADGDIGLWQAQRGVFQTRNAFEGPEPLLFSPVGGLPRPPGVVAAEGGMPTWSRRDRFDGDMNFDGVTDGRDLEELHSVFGTRSPFHDLTGDLLIDDGDIFFLTYLIDGEVPETPELTDRELRKKFKQYQKLFKKALKDELKADKAHAKADSKSYKKMRKELKKAEREARKAERDAERNAEPGGG